MTVRVITALATGALVVAGCGERSEPLGELQPSYPVTVAGAGEEPTSIDGRPERIVALTTGAAEILVELGAGSRVLGVPVGTREAPGDAAEVASPTGQVDVDEVAALDPDLLVAARSNDAVGVALAVRRTEAALYEQPAGSVEDVRRAVLELGSLVGEPLAARRLSGQIAERVGAIERRLEGEPVTTVFVDTGFFVTVPVRSLPGDLVRRAGGESVAGPTPGFEPFDLAELRRQDPDFYLATSDSRVTLARLRANPATRRLSAVREGRFAVVDADLVTTAGPRVDEALEAVARLLHPDAFR